MKRTSRKLQQCLSAVALAVAGLIVLGGCASGGSAPDDGPVDAQSDEFFDTMEPIELRFADVNAESAAQGQAILAWQEEVTELTDGKVTFDNYFLGSLYSPTEMLAGLGGGLADMGFIAPVFFQDQLPIANWTDQLLGAQSTLPHPLPFMVGLPAGSKILATTDAIREEYAKHNIVTPMGYLFGGPFPMLCGEPIESLEDAAGKRVTHYGQPYQGELEALGMVTTFLPPQDIYEALQRGVIDCAHVAPTAILADGYLDVTTHVSLLDSSSGAGGGAHFAFNKDSWEALPEQVQQVMKEAQGALQTTDVRLSLEDEAKLVAEAEALGLTFTDPSELNEVIRPHRESVLSQLLASPPPGIDDAEAYAEALQEPVQDWVEILESMGVEGVDPSDPEAVRTSFSESAEKIDWAAYEAAVREYLATY